VADRRIVEEEYGPERPNRSRGPIIGLLILMTLVLVVLVLYLVSGDSDDSGDDVELDDIEVDIGDEDG
jgi:hypothetical protein